MRPTERLLLALGILAAALFGGLAIASLSAAIADDEELLLLCLFSLVTELWIAAGAWIAALLVRARPVVTLGLGRSQLSVRELALLVLGTLAASHALDGALDLSGHAQQSRLSELPRLLHGISGVQLAAAIVALGIAPGIAEELLCRGLVQRGLLRRFGPGVSIGIAAALFGALHREPVYALFAGLLGLYLGLAAYWADSTWAAIACHGVNNLAAVSLGVLISGAWVSPLSVGAAGGLALACLWAVGHSKTRFPRNFPRGPSEPLESSSAEAPI